MSSNISVNSFYNYWQNIPAYLALGNRASSITGLGGKEETRYFTLPTGYPDSTYTLASQESINNPNGLSQWNPYMVGIDLTQGMSTNPALIEAGNKLAYNSGFSKGLALRLSSSVAALSNMEAQIEATVKSDQLTDAQKQRLQSLLDQVKALKDKVAKIAEAGDLKLEDVEAIQGQIIALTKKASEVAKEIAKEVQDKADKKSDAADNADDAGKADGAEGASDADDADKKSETGKIDEKTEAGKKQKELNKKAVNICQDIYTGTVGSSFRASYGKINSGVSQINKENVATVLNTWDKQYAKNGKGLVETLFDQEWCWNDSLDKNARPGEKIANPGKSNVNVIWNIVATLDQRAQELGIKEDLAGQFAVAYDELDDTFVDQKAVQGAVANIQKAVTEAENEKAAKSAKEETDGKAKADAANKKAEADKKKAEENAKKEKEAKTLFLSDMREVLKDDNAEISDKVKYKDGNFVVRIDGIEYEGSNYVELARAIKNAGYKPEQYLKKSKVNQKA